LSSRKNSKNLLTPEIDMPLALADHRACNALPVCGAQRTHKTYKTHEPQDLTSYLEFLEEMGALETRKPVRKYYSEKFSL